MKIIDFKTVYGNNVETFDKAVKEMLASDWKFHGVALGSTYHGFTQCFFKDDSLGQPTDVKDLSRNTIVNGYALPLCNCLGEGEVVKTGDYAMIVGLPPRTVIGGGRVVRKGEVGIYYRKV